MNDPKYRELQHRKDEPSTSIQNRRLFGTHWKKILFLFLFAEVLLSSEVKAQLSPTSSPTNPSLVAVPGTDNPTSFPTKKPTNTPTKIPSNNPTKIPTDEPTKTPTKNPTKAPTNNPTKTTTNIPTKDPSISPTKSPTKDPTKSPTKNPSAFPSIVPTIFISNFPSLVESNTPTEVFSDVPSVSPTVTSSVIPSLFPTKISSGNPTNSPSVVRSDIPTNLPSVISSDIPTELSSQLPSNFPTRLSSFSPSNTPTIDPTISLAPSTPPTDEPTVQSSIPPTTTRSSLPTLVSSSLPTLLPTLVPSSSPSLAPSYTPTGTPTISSIPSVLPTSSPSSSPSTEPSISKAPTKAPTPEPTISAPPSSRPSLTPTLEPSSKPSKSPTGFPTFEKTQLSTLVFEQHFLRQENAVLQVNQIKSFCQVLTSYTPRFVKAQHVTTSCQIQSQVLRMTTPDSKVLRFPIVRTGHNPTRGVIEEAEEMDDLAESSDLMISAPDERMLQDIDTDDFPAITLFQLEIRYKMTYESNVIPVEGYANKFIAYMNKNFVTDKPNLERLKADLKFEGITIFSAELVTVYNEPTLSPTFASSFPPSKRPSSRPSTQPSLISSGGPSTSPSQGPTKSMSPTLSPSVFLSVNPSFEPTQIKANTSKIAGTTIGVLILILAFALVVYYYYRTFLQSKLNKGGDDPSGDSNNQTNYPQFVPDSPAMEPSLYSQQHQEQDQHLHVDEVIQGTPMRYGMSNGTYITEQASDRSHESNDSVTYLDHVNINQYEDYNHPHYPQQLHHPHHIHPLHIDQHHFIPPNEDMISSRSLISGVYSVGSDSMFEQDPGNHLIDEFDEYRDQGLEKMRDDIEASISESDDMMSQAMTRAYMMDDDDLMAEGIDPNFIGPLDAMDVEVTELCATNDWKKKRQGATVDEK